MEVASEEGEEVAHSRLDARPVEGGVTREEDKGVLRSGPRNDVDKRLVTPLVRQAQQRELPVRVVPRRGLQESDGPLSPDTGHLRRRGNAVEKGALVRGVGAGHRSDYWNSETQGGPCELRGTKHVVRRCGCVEDGVKAADDGVLPAHVSVFKVHETLDADHVANEDEGVGIGTPPLTLVVVHKQTRCGECGGLVMDCHMLRPPWLYSVAPVRNRRGVTGDILAGEKEAASSRLEREVWEGPVRRCSCSVPRDVANTFAQAAEHERVTIGSQLDCMTPERREEARTVDSVHRHHLTEFLRSGKHGTGHISCDVRRLPYHTIKWMRKQECDRQ
jgi:hypothetical protein